MYTSQDLAIRIKAIAKEKNTVIKDMLAELSLGSNTMSALYHGKSIAFDSLAKIADYLDCSVDYLLGRVDTPNGTYSINNHNTTVNGTQANVINNNTAPEKPDNITEQFFEKFETLSFEEKVDTMQYVNKNYKK